MAGFGSSKPKDSEVEAEDINRAGQEVVVTNLKITTSFSALSEELRRQKLKRSLRNRPLSITLTRIRMILKRQRPNSRKLPMLTKSCLTPKNVNYTISAVRSVSKDKVKAVVALVPISTTSSNNSLVAEEDHSAKEVVGVNECTSTLEEEDLVVASEALMTTCSVVVLAAIITSRRSLKFLIPSRTPMSLP